MDANWIQGKGEKNLVSVIIPTYNRADLLREAVQSVFEQTYRPIECMIVDDGSTDNTSQVVNELKKLEENNFSIEYVIQPNAGSQAARNNGTIHSTGEFIQYLDSDDLLYPAKLKEQVEYLQAHENCNAVFGDWETGTDDQKVLKTAYLSDDVFYQVLAEMSIANFSFLMRRSLISAIGRWDVTVKRNQEIDYHLRGLLSGGVYHYQPVVTGLWRTHAGERIFNRTTFSSAIQFYQKWESNLLNEGIWSDKFKIGVANNYIWFLNEYPDSNHLELRKLLLEIKRLNPAHPIFNNKKFKLTRFFAGTEMAIDAWVKIYKKKKANG